MTSLLRASGLAVLLVLGAGVLVFSSVQGGERDTAAPPDPEQGVDAWTRVLEPVTITGAGLPQFDGVPLDELFVYAFSGTTWEQTPFEVDEVDAGGAYTVEDGLLDANDELVFMAMDLGQQANSSQWLEDPDSQNYVRYEVTVTDPLNPAQQGWVYVYRSATLVPAFADYVVWDAGNNRIVAGTYILGFEPETHAGTDSLELDGSGIDVLDRGKLRVNVICWIGPFPVEVTLTEEDLAGGWGGTPSIDGAVRAGGGSIESYSWSYHSLYGGKLVLDVEGIDPPDPCTDIDVNWLRASSDWLDPTGTGMAPAFYYDDNTPPGVAIDGAPDAIPPSPSVSFQQVSGSRGSLVQVMDIQLGGGTVTNYYKDDDTLDPDDTGEDQRSYGDAGYLVEAPTGQAVVDISTFVLDPGQPNVGATYTAYHANPLLAEAAPQTYEPPCDPVFNVYLPVILRSWP